MRFFYEANILPTQQLATEFCMRKFVALDFYFSDFAEHPPEHYLRNQVYPIDSKNYSEKFRILLIQILSTI